MERIKELIEKEKMSVRSLALFINVSQPSVDRYLKGQQRPTWEFAEKILENFPDVSAEWLMRGEGEMYKVPQTLDDKVKTIGELYYEGLVDDLNKIKNQVAMLESKIS